jgi:hypothetical protein
MNDFWGELECEYLSVIKDLATITNRDDQIETLYGKMPITLGLLLVQDVLTPTECIDKICRKKMSKVRTRYIDSYCRFIIGGETIFPHLILHCHRFRTLVRKEKCRILKLCYGRERLTNNEEGDI